MSGLGLAVMRGFNSGYKWSVVKGVYGPGNEKQPAGPQPSAGAGCGSGPRGLRLNLTLGFLRMGLGTGRGLEQGVGSRG